MATRQQSRGPADNANRRFKAAKAMEEIETDTKKRVGGRSPQVVVISTPSGSSTLERVKSRACYGTSFTTATTLALLRRTATIPCHVRSSSPPADGAVVLGVCLRRTGAVVFGVYVKRTCAVGLGVYLRRTGAVVWASTSDGPVLPFWASYLPHNVHDVPPAGAAPTGRPEGDDERKGGGGRGDGRGRLHAGEEREQKVHVHDGWEEVPRPLGRHAVRTGNPEDPGQEDLLQERGRRPDAHRVQGRERLQEGRRERFRGRPSAPVSGWPDPSHQEHRKEAFRQGPAGQREVRPSGGNSRGKPGAENAAGRPRRPRQEQEGRL